MLLLRHGQSEWNAVRRWQGTADPPLTALGRRQARATADVLQRLDVSFTGVWASDLQRAENQQTLIKALVEQKLKPLNAPRLLKAGSQIMRYIQTDLSWQQTVELFNIFRLVTPSEIHSMTVPVSDASSGGIYYSALVESEFHNRLSRMYDFLEGRVRIDCPVTVLNGSGQAGVARLAAERLSEAGFNQVQSDNAEEYDHTRTSIEYHGDTRMAAERVREALGCGRINSAEGDTQEESVTVTLGSDFAEDQ